LGCFLGKLGRDRVCLLIEPSVEIFSDFSRVVYYTLDEQGRWKFDVARELRNAG
jgi:predicted nucleotide-binding protein